MHFYYYYITSLLYQMQTQRATKTNMILGIKRIKKETNDLHLFSGYNLNFVAIFSSHLILFLFYYFYYYRRFFFFVVFSSCLINAHARASKEYIVERTQYAQNKRQLSKFSDFSLSRWNLNKWNLKLMQRETGKKNKFY